VELSTTYRRRRSLAAAELPAEASSATTPIPARHRVAPAVSAVSAAGLPLNVWRLTHAGLGTREPTDDVHGQARE